MTINSTKLYNTFTPKVIKYLKENKSEITSDLLTRLREYGNEGKQIAIDILDLEKDSEEYYLDAFNNRLSFNGNRRLKKSHAKLSIYPIHKKELQKCINDINYFKRNYVKIITPNGVNFPELREYQDKFIEVIIPDENESIISLQPRQSGKTVTIGIYLAHLFLFKKDINIGIAANKGRAAAEFLDKTKKILIELPIWMQAGIEFWNKTYIENENGVRILTDSTSSDSFRGFTCLEKNEPIEVFDKFENCYKTLTLGEMYNSLLYKNTYNFDLKINNRFLIKTSSGYRDFDGIQESKSKGLIITFKNKQIKCTENHMFCINKNTFKEAKDLKIGDFIFDEQIINIENEIIEQTYFDPINVQGDNTYLCKGIINHNCAVVIVDEAAFVKTNLWDEFSDSIFPSQSGLAWKKNILISTANGMNHFYNIIQGARKDVNGYVNYEVSWKDVPRYNSKKELISNEEFQKSITDKYGDLYFQQNYGNNFLGSAATLLSPDKLQSLKEAEIQEIRDGKLKIYEYPKDKHQYIMTIDAAKDGKDAFAVQIVDITDFKFIQVAAAKLQIDYLLMPEFIDEWCILYNKPYLIIENNEGAGQSIADQMYQSYEYENLHFDSNSDSNSRNRIKSRKKYPGFRTTTKSRKQIIQTMKLFIENNNIVINDKSTINEFFNFILIKNKYQADEGSHDDMIMSLALVFAPFCNTKNFEDMKKIVQGLYNNENEFSNKTNFVDLLSIGSFNDYTDEYIENDDNTNTEYEYFNGKPIIY